MIKMRVIWMVKILWTFIIRIW